MNVLTRTMEATTIWIRITVSGIPVLITTGIIPGGDMAATILPGIMAVITVVVATTDMAVTTLAGGDLKSDDGELLTADAIPVPGAGGGPDWKAIRKESNLADEYLVGKVGNIGAVGEAGEMGDTEEVWKTEGAVDIGVKDHQGRSEIPALRPKGVRSDEAQDEAQDEAHGEK